MILIILSLICSAFFASCVGRAIYCLKDAKVHNDIERIKKYGKIPLIESVVFIFLCIIGTVTGVLVRFGINIILLIAIPSIIICFLLIGTIVGIVYSNSAIKNGLRPKMTK